MLRLPLASRIGVPVSFVLLAPAEQEATVSSNAWDEKDHGPGSTRSNFITENVFKILKDSDLA